MSYTRARATIRAAPLGAEAGHACIRDQAALQGKWWRGLDLNQRRENPADLQSAAIDRSATPPWVLPAPRLGDGTMEIRGKKSTRMLQSTHSKTLSHDREPVPEYGSA